MSLLRIQIFQWNKPKDQLVEIDNDLKMRNDLMEMGHAGIDHTVPFSAHHHL